MPNGRQLPERTLRPDDEHPQLARAIARLRLMFQQFHDQQDWGTIAVSLIFREGVPVTVQGTTTVSDKSA